MFNREASLVDPDADNKAIDANEALQELGADDVAFGYLTTAIVVCDADAKQANDKLLAVERIINGRGFVTIRETLNAVEQESAAMNTTEPQASYSRVPKKATPPKLTDFPVQTSEKLRFADTDRQGHITNTVFAVCCQNARMELLCNPRRAPIPVGTQFVIAKLVLEFRAEMHWPGTVEVGTRVERIGRASVTLAQALFVGDRCVAIAESIVALMDTATRRSVLLPHETVEALRATANPTCHGINSALPPNAQLTITPDFLRTLSR